jgi:hypothetical protein
MSLANWTRVSLIAAMSLGVSLAHAANEAPEMPKVAASGVKLRDVKPAAGGVVKVPEVKGTAGGVTGKGGERQYPSSTIPIPPKPKKEGLEAAEAIKAKAATAQP